MRTSFRLRLLYHILRTPNNPPTVLSPAIGTNAYYITDSTNRTSTFYGAYNWNGGTDKRVNVDDSIRFRAVISVSNAVKSMYVWQGQDFLIDRSATVTNCSFKCSSSEAVTNRWMVEKSGQFYVSQETLGKGLVETNVSTRSRYDFTPFSNSIAVIGAPATVKLHELGSVGVYLEVTRTNAGGIWQDMRNISYFAVHGVMDPNSTVIMIK